MKKYDFEYISELEKIDEKYIEMSEEEIVNKLDQLLQRATQNNITEWVSFLLSEKYHYQGNYYESLTHTLEAINIAPQNYYFLSSLATTYYAMENYEDSIFCYTAAIKANPQFYRAYIDRASVYRRIRNYPFAIDDAKYVIDHTTDCKTLANAKLSLARSYILSSNSNLAKDILYELKEDLADSSEYYETLAVYHEELHEYEVALSFYNQAREICKDDNLSSILEAKIKIYEAKLSSKTLTPFQEMFNTLNMASEEDSDLMKVLTEHNNRKKFIKDSYRKEYLSSKRKRDIWMKNNYLLCLKGWSSTTPTFSLGRDMDGKKFNGGGIFIRWEGKGIVIDPGINFIENFHDANLFIQDINYVVVTHNHIDHKCDLNTIIDLDYQFSLNIKYFLDENTYKECENLFNDLNHKNRVHVIEFPESTDTCKKELYKNKINMVAFKTFHNCPGSFGIKLELLSKNNIILSYTSDTGYYPELVKHVDGSQIIIANFSETDTADLLLQKFKPNHLGLNGCLTLLNNLTIEPSIFFLSEFWGGLGDIRIEISKRLKFLKKNKEIPIIPADIGMVCTLIDLKICCTSCKKHFPINEIRIRKPMLSVSNNNLQYMCCQCAQVLTNDTN